MSSPLLSDAEVLIVDCQATGASPAHGSPLELGWARVRAGEALAPGEVVARLLRLPLDATVPRAVTRVTGLRDDDLRAAVEPRQAWAELTTLAAAIAHRAGSSRTPTVIHFARFEEAFLRALHTSIGEPAELPFEIVCTHEIARRLLPDLPRRGLRALTGYFGQAVGPLRRSAQHVTATAFVWGQLVEALAGQGVTTFADLGTLLASPAGQTARRRVYPMPRPLRLSVPEQPGVYRMLRIGGDVLYVGKATVLRERVNAHFRKQSGLHERTLEMLAQARDLSWTTTETALEAALLETDEIKKLRPPYNVALLEEGRSLWYATSDLRAVRRSPDGRHALGPFSAREIVDAFGLLATLLDTPGRAVEARERGLVVGVPARWAPSQEALSAGLERLRADHGPILGAGGSTRSRLVGLGAASWEKLRAAVEPEAPEEPPQADRSWDAAAVTRALETLAVRAAHALRRASWIMRLSESTIVFREPTALPAGRARSLSIEHGEIAARATVADESGALVPAGFERTRDERRRALTVASFDRLRVLTTELRRAVGRGEASAEVRFGPRPALRGKRLALALSWV